MMWRAWKWFVNASQVFEFKKVKYWYGDSRIQSAALVPLSFSCLLGTITITTKPIIIIKSSSVYTQLQLQDNPSTVVAKN